MDPDRRDLSFDMARLVRKNRFAVASMVVGLAALLVAIVIQDSFWSSPDWRVLVPMSVVAAVLSLVSILQREPRWSLALAGSGLAVCGLALGWVFIVVGIVVGVSIAIAIMHEVF